jgi:hypothetical protein
MKKFTISILVLSFVLMSASIVLAVTTTHPTPPTPVVINTAPTNFGSTIGSTCSTPSADCQDTFTWEAITGYMVQGYVLEVTAHYLSPTGTSANCPDTVLRKTFDVPASSCTSSGTPPTVTCSDTVDLLNNVGLTGYTVISVDASVSAIIMPWWKSTSFPNGAASIVKESVNSCPTPQ